MSDAEARIRDRTLHAGSDPFDWFIRVPNRLAMMRPIRQLVNATCENYGVDEEAVQELLLAISEIVNNAIEHVEGRGDDGYHEVDFYFGVADGCIYGRVIDEGEGSIGQDDFDAAAIPSLDSDRGRGLMLINAYVDSLEVKPVPGVGTSIRFVKKAEMSRPEGLA